jgi:hypothetical protein
VFLSCIYAFSLAPPLSRTPAQSLSSTTTHILFYEMLNPSHINSSPHERIVYFLALLPLVVVNFATLKSMTLNLLDHGIVTTLQRVLCTTSMILGAMILVRDLECDATRQTQAQDRTQSYHATKRAFVNIALLFAMSVLLQSDALFTYTICVVPLNMLTFGVRVVSPLVGNLLNGIELGVGVRVLAS